MKAANARPSLAADESVISSSGKTVCLSEENWINMHTESRSRRMTATPSCHSPQVNIVAYLPTLDYRDFS